MPLCLCHLSQASSSLLSATQPRPFLKPNVCSPKHTKTSMLSPDGRTNQSVSLIARNWTRKNFTKTTKLSKRVSCLLTVVPMTKWSTLATIKFKWSVKIKVLTKTSSITKQPTSLRPQSKSKTSSCNTSTPTRTSRTRLKMLSNRLKTRFNPTLKMTSTRRACKEIPQQKLLKQTTTMLWLLL